MAPTDDEIRDAQERYRALAESFRGFYSSGLPWFQEVRPEIAPEERRILGTGVTVRAPDAAANIIYGTQVVSGQLVFITGDVPESDSEYLHLVLVIAAHEINGFKGLYLDDQLITFTDTNNPNGDATGVWGAKVAMYSATGSESQSAIPELISQSDLLFPGLWSAAHMLRGLAHVYLRLQYDSDLFPNGFPKIRVKVEGKNSIYDPRDASTGYSANAALCIADYLTDTKIGLKLDYATRINETELIDGANVSDETVTTNAGTENRYEINATFSTADRPRAILESMANAIGGSFSGVGARAIYPVGGVYEIRPAKWRGTYSATFSPTDIDNCSLWLDAAQGTTFAEYNDVDSWADQSGNGNDFTDGGSTARPFLCRADNKENWCLYSEAFTNWDQVDVTVADNDTADPLGGGAGAKITCNATTAQHRVKLRSHNSWSVKQVVAGGRYKISVYLKKGTNRYVFIGDEADAVWRGAVIDLDKGSGAGSDSYIYAESNIDRVRISEDEGGNWIRVIVEETRTNGGALAPVIALQNDAGPSSTQPDSFAAAGTETVYVFGAQCGDFDSDDDYLATSGTRETRGINGNAALQFDGENDTLVGGSVTNADLYDSDGYTVFAALQPRAITEKTVATYNNDGVLSDTAAGLMGLGFKKVAGDDYRIEAYQNDGSYQTINSVIELEEVLVFKYGHSGDMFARLNGSDESDSTSSDPSVGAQATVIGKGWNSSSYGAFKLGELIIYDRALDDDEATQVEDYLAKKYKSTLYNAPLFDNNDLRSSSKIQVKNSLRDSINQVRGTYLSADSWEIEEFPSATNATYLAADNGIELPLDVTLPAVTSAATCQRLGKLEVERARQPLEEQALFCYAAHTAKPGDVVYRTNSRLGWSFKPFEVIDARLSIGSGESPYSYAMRLRETESAIFDWNNGEETTVDTAPNSYLPDPTTVKVPTALTLASGTAHLYRREDGTIFSRIKVSWTEPADPFVKSGGRYEIQYKQSSASDWQESTAIPGGNTFTYLLDVQDGINYDVRIRSVNNIGNPSSWVTSLFHTVAGKSAAPANVTGFTATKNKFGIFLNWTQIADLDLSHYEIRLGSTWATAALVAKVNGTNYQVETKTSGSYTYKVKAVDTSGNYSSTEATVSVTITAPSTPSVSHSIEGANVVLSWGASTGDFAIEDYEIRYGSSYGASTLVATVKGTSYAQKANWSGVRTYWLTARDVADNESANASLSVTITAPGAVSDFLPKVVDNNVSFSWTAPTAGTLPIDEYRIKRGASYAAGTLLAAVTARYANIFETVGGRYTYHIAAVDTAGNEGSSTALEVVVLDPPDFVLRGDDTVDPTAADLTNAMALSSTAALVPVNTTETFADHFDNNGSPAWTSIQDAIDDSYTYLITPVPNSAEIQEVIDYGSALAASKITLSWVETSINGSLTITPEIEHSTDDVSYTSLGNVSQAVANNFRYLRVTLDITPANDKSFSEIADFRVVVDAKTTKDRGEATCNSGDSGGTTITWNKTFLDIDGGPQLSVESSSDYSVTWQWVNGSDKTQGIKVLVWNSGSRVTADVAWEISGFVESS